MNYHTICSTMMLFGDQPQSTDVLHLGDHVVPGSRNAGLTESRPQSREEMRREEFPCVELCCAFGRYVRSIVAFKE